VSIKSIRIIELIGASGVGKSYLFSVTNAKLHEKISKTGYGWRRFAYLYSSALAILMVVIFSPAIILMKRDRFFLAKTMYQRMQVIFFYKLNGGDLILDEGFYQLIFFSILPRLNKKYHGILVRLAVFLSPKADILIFLIASESEIISNRRTLHVRDTSACGAQKKTLSLSALERDMYLIESSIAQFETLNCGRNPLIIRANQSDIIDIGIHDFIHSQINSFVI